MTKASHEVKLKINIGYTSEREEFVMDTVINAKTLRSDLAAVMERVKKGERFMVLYRSHPVCRLIPVDSDEPATGKLEEDSLYRAGPVGRSADGLSAADHDEILYEPSKRKRK